MTTYNSFFLLAEETEAEVAHAEEDAPVLDPKIGRAHV